MENEICINFPGSTIRNSAFYSEYSYDPQDYDKALDEQANAILEQCDDFSESEFYQEGVLDEHKYIGRKLNKQNMFINSKEFLEKDKAIQEFIIFATMQTQSNVAVQIPEEEKEN